MEDSCFTVFDPDGDIRLLVFDHSSEHPEGEPFQKTFLVNSRVMSLASNAWKAMFNGHFKEAQPSANREVSFPDDDPRSLEILLNIAHMRYDLVPQKLSFPELLQLTVMTDKYGATKLLSPWCKAWMDNVMHLLQRPNHEEWLWIAWELGQAETFKTLVSFLAKNAWVDKDGRLCSPHGRTIYPREDPLHLPPEIAECIVAFQKDVVRELCSIYNSYLDIFVAESSRRSTNCSHGFRFERRLCDATAYGYLMLALRRLHLPTEKSERDSHLAMSPAFLVDKLESVTTDTSQHKDSHRCENSTIHTEIGKAATRLFKRLQPPLLDMHHRHLKRQAEILGLKT